ncbi:glycoside hydrolase family 2 protein [Marinoscillum pacificum]|uniref:glycoside hydrolase family 2 protein n=1 Tax=Marinoscillum pacificum TaxID=392723 RepID=UPI0021582C2D|nr:glycoside hydrolase family 2 protein [Marinoscillum pacificum]
MRRAIGRSYALVVALLLVAVLTAQSQERMTNINESWEYLEKDYQTPDQALVSEGWSRIDLPHTWNALDATDVIPGYRRSASWYKKSLKIATQADKRYFLYFEGSNMVTEVYVNQVKAGGHVGGYIGFEVEITEQLRNGENEVLIRVDNSYNKQLIPSNQSDFFLFGGITRDLWLKTVSSTFIEDVTIATPSVSAAVGQTNVQVDVDGPSIKGHKINLKVKNPAGKVVYTKETAVQDGQVTFEFSEKNPVLWDVSNPQLYTVEVALLDGKKQQDAVSDRYGYRWFEFKDHGPFYLNGKRLLLRGTHRHEEYAGIGAAIPNAMHRSDMEAIKEMGANFVRLGHYPQDPEIYKACDELGILVWDELPWCRGGVGDDVWKANTKRLLTEMIDQDYNHPSVILWSLGNEIYWLPEFENGDDPAKINEFLSEINDLAHELDPYRKTSIRKYYEGADIVDVFSPSIWSGWYSGTYKNYEKAVNNSLKKYNHFIHMEYGGSSHVGRHTETPITGDGELNPNEWEEPINQVAVTNIAQSGDWSENYIVDLFDWHLRVSETNPDFVGNAQWAFRDFGTPLRPENDIPYMNQKGLQDRAGKPKDAYYVFKSYWSEEPFAYIESHTWTERSGPQDVARNISVYSNAAQVELFHNGKSLGVKKRDIQQFPACGLNWDLTFAEGANQLKAVAMNAAGKQLAQDDLEVNYTYTKAGNPEELALNYELLDNGHYLVTATALDNHQQRVLDYEEKVYFQCLAGGKVIESYGTPYGSSVIAMANGKATIEVVPEVGAEQLSMTVLNQSFKGTFLTIKLKTNTSAVID